MYDNNCTHCIQFKTENHKYLYYSDSRAIFNSNISQDRESFLKKYALIKDNSFFDIKEVTQDEVKKEIYAVGLTELILDVTTQCNLRCEYCIFGGNYDFSRIHSNDFMTFETAKKAIDWYYHYLFEASSYNPYRTPVVAFYGGEPLLNFELIKFCVNYIKGKYRKQNTYFTLTTNGTLLSDEIISFLVQENIHPIVSLDGPKSEHDRNRIFPNGVGTFDTIYKNITKLYDRQKEPITTILVYDIRTDLQKVANFIDNETKIVCINSVPVKSYNTDYYQKFTSEEKQRFLKSEKKLRDYFFTKVLGNNDMMFSFANRYFVDRCLPFINNRVDANPVNPRLIKMTGACIPGNKISVSVDGTFHMCEKISRQFPIGDVNDGLDFKQITQLVNDYNRATKSCINCNFRNSCSNCEVVLESNNCFKVNLENCAAYKRSFMEDLTFAYTILEKNPMWTHESISKYYKELQEMVVRFK